MARKPRIECSSGLYHIINRGNYRSHLFKSEGAKQSFLKTLFEACEKFSWKLSAFCLMSNHYHLCIGTPSGNLSSGMRWLQATFAMRFNKYRKEKGHLFQGRFKSLAVEPGEHWLALIDYIHLNPVRAGLVESDVLGKYPWTSLYFFPKRSSRPVFLNCEWMDYFDDYEDSKGGWIRYHNHLKAKSAITAKERNALEKQMCRGWSVGSDAFTKLVSDELKDQETLRGLKGNDLADFNRARWKQCLKQCLAHLGKSLEDAQEEKRSAGWKLAIAARLKRETSVTNAWLAAQLHMGTPRSVSAICGVYSRRSEASCRMANKLNKLTIDH